MISTLSLGSLKAVHTLGERVLAKMETKADRQNVFVFLVNLVVLLERRDHYTSRFK